MYDHLGRVLETRGVHPGSLEMSSKGHEPGSGRPGWCQASARWVADAERPATLDDRLQALLKSEDRPKDLPVRLAPAQRCYDTKQSAAAGFWAEALEADPRLGDDRKTRHPSNAALAVALAGPGRGEDDPAPNAPALVKLRRQALDWLRAELAIWTSLLDSGDARTRPGIAQILRHRRDDTDLAGLRVPGRLAGLPDAEQKAWQGLRVEVDALLKKARGGRP